MTRKPLVVAALLTFAWPAAPALAQQESTPGLISAACAAPCTLGSTVTVSMRHGSFEYFAKEAAARGKEEPAPWGLVLDGMLVAPSEWWWNKNDREEVIQFRLERTKDNNKAWITLLGGHLLAHNVTAQVGVPGSSAMTTPVPLRIAPWEGVKSWAIIVVAALMLLFVWYTIARYRLLEDRVGPGKRSTYSLARTQLTLWTVSVALAYLAIWAVTGSTDPIDPTVLGLLGISSITSIAASIVDMPGADGPHEKRDPVAEEPAPLAGEPPPIAEGPPASLAPPARSKVQQFLADILNDGRGVSIHRLQMVLFTVLLLVVFWGSVYRTLSMPAFDNSLLGLMGISSGTYLLLKTKEK